MKERENCKEKRVIPNWENGLLKKKFGRIIRSIIVMVVFIWIVWSNVTVGVTRYLVVSDRVPKTFESYTIVLISDLHNAQFGANNSRLLSNIEKERPDMIAITGDLVDSGKTNIEVADSLIKELVEMAPCYYVTGNHEAWIGKQYQELERKLLDAGVVVLHNKSVNLKNNKETIQIAGLDDPDFSVQNLSVRENTPEAKLKEMNLTEDYCILLSHRPEDFSAYVSENIDLVLAGHAHGGQFRLPFIGGMIAPGQGLFPAYDGGEYSENHTTMIVSRGIGNSVIPIRIHNRPEVVVVKLKSGK